VMKYYEDFFRSGRSFEDRVGDPDERDAAAGQIALGFTFLEDTARNMIMMLAGTDFNEGCIVTAKLSFRQKLNVLASLIKQKLRAVLSSEERAVIEAQTNELLSLCWRAEALRNTYLYSNYAREERAKMTAKHGLRRMVERVDSSLLLDVADFINYSGMELESLPIMLDIADVVSASKNSISYSRNGLIVRTFRLGKIK